MTDKIELLKIKLDKHKHSHSKISTRFFASLITLFGIALLSPETFKQLIDGKLPAFSMSFLLLVLIYVLTKSAYDLFKIRGKIEEDYEKLEKEYN